MLVTDAAATYEAHSPAKWEKKKFISKFYDDLTNK